MKISLEVVLDARAGENEGLLFDKRQQLVGTMRFSPKLSVQKEAKIPASLHVSRTQFEQLASVELEVKE
jgi:hypothetical protein